MQIGVKMKNWICVSLDPKNSCLWTADLFNGVEWVRNLGGSYQKIAQVIFDARQCWGNNLSVKIFPEGYNANIKYKGEIF